MAQQSEVSDSRDSVVIVIDEVIFSIRRAEIIRCSAQVMDAGLGLLPAHLLECFVPTSR